jgi:BirA family biotin operon repressor/biotin-[acetyl-CoA-carboxylase] ligase
MTEGAARVLAALREAPDRPSSGEDLSSELGVTRAQIWKHVEALRKLGYEIEGAAGGGYRLAAVPDRLYPAELSAGLETRWLARSIEWLDVTDSTNRVAAERAREGAPHGTAVIAESQTAGRGRLGRTFYSPPHQSLYVSFVLRPEIDTRAAPTTILAAAVAVAETVAAELGAPDRVEIKWPNDVLIDGRKTSGILMEMASEATHVRHLVLGIGVNLNVDPARFPEEFRATATSVGAAAGRPVDRISFVRHLFGTLESVLDLHSDGGFTAVRERFDRFYRMVGRAVQVTETGGKPLAGIALAPDPDGSLPLQREDGSLIRVVAGDVTLSHPPGQAS